MTQINPDLPDLGQPNWGTPLNSALTEIITQSNANDKVNTEIVSVKFFGAKGDGLTDDSAAIVTALAASVGKTLYFPAGTYIVASATRLVLSGNSTSIVGDPGGLSTVISFTSASGGLDIGNGTDIQYENRLTSITFLGNGVVTNLVRCRKMYEPFWSQVRVENGSRSVGSKLIELNDCGQLDTNRLVVTGGYSGIEVTGASPVLTFTARLSNFFDCVNGIRIATGASSGIPKIRMNESWFEAVSNIVNIETGSNSVSLGDFSFSNCYYLKATGDFRLVKATSTSGANINRMVFESSVIQAAGSTSPLVDFSSVDNSAAIAWVTLRELNVNLSGSATEPLIKTQTAQAWYVFHTKVNDIMSPSGLLDPARWSGNPFNTGGTWPDPYRLASVGAPEGVIAAPTGSIYVAQDLGKMYMKNTGNGNTGWKLVTQAA